MATVSPYYVPGSELNKFGAGTGQSSYAANDPLSTRFGVGANLSQAEQSAQLAPVGTVGQAPTGAAQSHLYQPDPSLSASLAVSPAWLAFRRSLGIEDATDAATAQAQVDALNRRAGLARGDTAESGKIQREQIGGGFEARGLYRSGARLRDQARQQSAEARALGDIELNLAEQIAGLTGGLAQRQAGRQRQSAETGMDVAYQESLRGY